MTITRISQLTGKESTKDLPITEEQLKRFVAGELVQNVFPFLSAADREWLRSGITEQEWKDNFGE